MTTVPTPDQPDEPTLSAAIEAVLMVVDEPVAEVTLEFRDDGRPFDPLAAPPPDLRSPMEHRSTGGLGIHLLRSLVDAAEYVRLGSENVLTLKKRLGGAGRQT